MIARFQTVAILLKSKNFLVLSEKYNKFEANQKNKEKKKEI